MQPRTLALLLTLIPLLASNGAYLLSAYHEFIPWCVPYIDGCTTISRAARSGDSIFIFRASMAVYCVLLIWFWWYSMHWLDLLHGRSTKMAGVIVGLGVIGVLALLVYVEFLGTTGAVNRFMRRTGVMIYFTFTPLAQLLLLGQHYKILHKNPDAPISKKALRFQLGAFWLMLLIVVVSIFLEVTETKTYASENIVEWNFSLLMTLYFAGMVFIWKDYEQGFGVKGGGG